MVTNHIDDVINVYNSKLSKTYADFANALEEVKGIVPVDNHYLFDEHLARIDNDYQSLVMISRPHIRRFAEEAAKPDLMPLLSSSGLTSSPSSSGLPRGSLLSLSGLTRGSEQNQEKNHA